MLHLEAASWDAVFNYIKMKFPLVATLRPSLLTNDWRWRTKMLNGQARSSNRLALDAQAVQSGGHQSVGGQIYPYRQTLLCSTEKY